MLAFLGGKKKLKGMEKSSANKFAFDKKEETLRHPLNHEKPASNLVAFTKFSEAYLISSNGHGQPEAKEVDSDRANVVFVHRRRQSSRSSSTQT